METISAAGKRIEYPFGITKGKIHTSNQIAIDDDML